MYALVEIFGKQYKAIRGGTLRVSRVDGEQGSLVDFENVMLVSGETGVKVGAPYVAGVRVRAVVESHGKADKIIVGKYKKRKNYRRRTGHRQDFSVVRIEDIQGA